MVLSASRTKELHLLFVNYFAPMRELAGRSLASLGVSSVSMAADDVDAVQQIKNGEHFDLIISDWNMPNMMGLELLECARSEQKLKDPRVFNDYRGGYQVESHRCCKSWCLPIHRKTFYPCGVGGED